ncbi:uncharacterized protein IUM83_14923 [Phytophthora cinnamomi]|uniref:uncharacterized protein n=1 Tax=Phytophthora cinnamomi TaxID=4785 RepID=UPI00355A4F5D|nr:hypothetical protein IUM83_14923 [Phytophthora cinnamomi]
MRSASRCDIAAIVSSVTSRRLDTVTGLLMVLVVGRFTLGATTIVFAARPSVVAILSSSGGIALVLVASPSTAAPDKLASPAPCSSSTQTAVMIFVVLDLV